MPSASSTPNHSAAPHDVDARTHPLGNLRDLGGIAVSSGKVRPGMLWRADDPTISPRSELQTLAGQGLAAMLDLRSTPEASASPHRTAGELGIAHHHLPLAESAVHPLALVRAAPTMQSPADVGRWYAALVRNHLQEVVHALRIIGTAEGGVLFHCAAGKDRTGILAAVVLALLGADRNVIVEDYAATEQNMMAVIGRLRAAAYAQAAGAPANETAEDDSAQAAADFFASNHPLLGAVSDSMDSMLTDLGGEPGLMDLISHTADPDTLVGRLHQKLVN
ncbi:tyrosine-protein phosphatase [Garicola koreensis]|uniref:Protein-tyrosine phosphatase n=1 Tax=Garicola koreensis TaxID=1262554 RepID=A0A7W5Y007_9MICC|nr:tyrosine-protein phosphatase [Garicola koreensis]MBB3667956.1 protein-tyrosine phosphatase [Garicola koreensis]